MAPRANWKGVQRSQAKGPVCVIHRDAYKCNWSRRGNLHHRS